MTFLSIIIPFKKSKRYLKDCLSSIEEQNLTDKEIILIVNGSDEDIDDILIDDVRLVRYDEEIGVSRARNDALKLADGDYVYFIDSDDYLYGDALSKLVEVARDTGADFINGQRIVTYYIKNKFEKEFEVNNPKIEKRKSSDHEFSMRLLVNPSNDGDDLEVLSALHALIKRDKIDFEFNESKRYYADYEFMIKLLERIDSCMGIEDAIYAKRISDDFINLPSLNQEKKKNEFQEYIDQYKMARDSISSQTLKDLMAKKLFKYYYHILPRNYSDSQMDAFMDISDDFKGLLYSRMEVNALKSKNKSRALKMMNFRLNLKRIYNLMARPKMIYHTLYHRVYNKRPMNEKRIVFESFNGNYYSDSPKYIYEYLLENYGDDFEYVWIFKETGREVPGNPMKVKRYSLKYHKIMATSKYWIINTRQPARLVKRPGQVLVSTWHGTPLKRLGYDMDNVYLNNPRTKETYIRDSSMWDYFVSANGFSTEILKRAFAYDGEMLEIGYPRNDILYNADEEKINEIREKLNLPKDKKTILYAPTWRDNEAYDVGKVKFKIKLELDKMEKEFGDEYVVLVRNHYLITDSDVSDYGEFAVDVSRYEDIAELYLVSDILITDYSSVFFDYANLKRPVLFYMYDLDDYGDELRGFYIDVHTEVPGPILKTTEEVIEALKNIDEINAEYKERYEEFYNRFCYLEDGNASKRFVDKVFFDK